MPFKLPAEWVGKPAAQATVKHHPQQPDDKLRVLSDIIILKGPLDSVMSFGDLILSVGIFDVAYHASRKRKPRAARQSVEPPGSRTIDLTKLERQEIDEQHERERPLVLSNSRVERRVSGRN
jgi:hypothetical protein